MVSWFSKMSILWGLYPEEWLSYYQRLFVSFLIANIVFVRDMTTKEEIWRLKWLQQEEMIEAIIGRQLPVNADMKLEECILNLELEEEITLVQYKWTMSYIMQGYVVMNTSY